MRKYSVDEIDRMRQALEEIEWCRDSYNQAKSKTIEARLRTYMTNGTDPEELEQKAKLVNDEHDAKTQ